MSEGARRVTTAFIIVAICIHVMQLWSMLDRYICMPPSRRQPWQVVMMTIDLAVIVFAIAVLVWP
jgi:hypothetical protein